MHAEFGEPGFRELLGAAGIVWRPEPSWMAAILW
jgi:hypothetical protein